MNITKTEIKKLEKLACEYRAYSKNQYFEDILDSEMCLIISILARNKATTWIRQFTSNCIEVSTMCKLILEN